MKKGLSVFYIISLFIGIAFSNINAQQKMLPERGSLGFWFYVDGEYRNGLVPKGRQVTLLEVPDILRVQLQATSTAVAASVAALSEKVTETAKIDQTSPSSVVTLNLQWRMKGGNRLPLDVPYLPGKSRYYLAYRWDSNTGMFDGFLNGVPLRVPKTKVPKWEMKRQIVDFKADKSISELEVSEDIWTEEFIRNRAEKKPHSDVASLIGFGSKIPIENVEPLKETLLYAPDFSRQDVVNTWRMEGPGIYQINKEGWLSMESTEADKGPAGEGHIVFWTPEIFPESFVAQWEFQAISDDGLCIVFFAATGHNGKHLFDPRLNQRFGIFRQYTMGDIDCYHISYYANTPGNPGRITTNIRKNHGFYLVSNGQPAVPTGSKAIHNITLVKQKGNIRLGVDGISIIDWTDDGIQYGPVHGEGMIGFRQMKWMKGQYRNFKVWALSE